MRRHKVRYMISLRDKRTFILYAQAALVKAQQIHPSHYCPQEDCVITDFSTERDLSLRHRDRKKSRAAIHNISRDFFLLYISAKREKEGIARFYIAPHTLAEDPAGEVWINNGNLRNKFFPEGTTIETQLESPQGLLSHHLDQEGRGSGKHLADSSQTK